MRRKVSRGQGEEESDLNLTSMLDVVFIMLIFFVVTSSFAKDAGIEVDPPGAVTAERQERTSMVIAIDAQDAVWIDRRQVDVRAVRSYVERLHAEKPQGGVVIQADRRSTNGILVQVMDAARLAGVEQISLAASVVE